MSSAIRELCKGNFVLKGIMHPDDAIRAHSLGVDGIMVSNHGARQLDNAPSPLQVLPAIRDAVGDKMTVMFDGGIRRGLDAIIALCMGAKFVFQGRPTLYGVTAGGVQGAKAALGIFRREIDISMAQMGADQDRRSRPAIPDVEGRGGPAPQPALTVVDFYLGLGSRYSYLAASQVDRLEAQYGCRFVWKPIASGALIDRRGDNPFRRPDGVGQYDRAYREYDAGAWAAHYGIPFREPTAFKVEADVPALACLAAERQGALVACCRALFAMIFAEGATIDAAAIDALPARLDLDARAFRRDIEVSRDTGATRDIDRRGSSARRVRRADLLPRGPDVLGQRPATAARGSAARRQPAALAIDLNGHALDRIFLLGHRKLFCGRARCFLGNLDHERQRRRVRRPWRAHYGQWVAISGP